MPKKHKNKKWIMVALPTIFRFLFGDEKTLALFKLFLRREEPHWLVLNGDFQDFWEISNFDLTPKIGKALIEEIKIGKKILKSFRRILPRARITWIEGNHEFRLKSFMDYQGSPCRNLKDLEIEYAGCHRMASKLTDNFIRVGILYRVRDSALEVFLVHPGEPFWVKKGFWRNFYGQ